ncbi:MAG: zinc-binding dehydrogenase [Betaproteobacteria bacterium]
MNTTMRAVRLHAQDGHPLLRLDSDVPVPSPGPGEVLLAVKACGINQVDLLTHDGQTPQPVKLPHISGTEVAGDIVALGEGVSGWTLGQAVVLDPILHCGQCVPCRAGETNQCRHSRVFGVQTPGGYGEYVAAPARQLLALPTGMSHAQAASAAVTGPTAWHMLHRRAELRVGQDVLIVAAGSGIGVIGTQIAKLAGARVIATVGSEEKMQQARELGADLVVNHSQPDWAEEVRRFTEGRGVDIVFEHVGAATWASSLKALARGGKLVTCGGHSGFQVDINLWHLFVKEHSLIGSFAATRQDFLDVMRLLGQGRIRPVIQQVFPLEGLEAAQTLMRQRKVFGKLLLDPTLK